MLKKAILRSCLLLPMAATSMENDALKWDQITKGLLEEYKGEMKFLNFVKEEIFRPHFVHYLQLCDIDQMVNDRLFYAEKWKESFEESTILSILRNAEYTYRSDYIYRIEKICAVSFYKNQKKDNRTISLEYFVIDGKAGFFVYRGESVNKKRNGEGEAFQYTFSNGQIDHFSGVFKNDRIQGRMKQIQSQPNGFFRITEGTIERTKYNDIKWKTFAEYTFLGDENKNEGQIMLSTGSQVINKDGSLDAVNTIFPKPIWFKVFNFFDVTDLLKMKKVCKQLNEWIGGSNFFIEKLIADRLIKKFQYSLSYEDRRAFKEMDLEPYFIRFIRESKILSLSLRNDYATQSLKMILNLNEVLYSWPQSESDFQRTAFLELIADGDEKFSENSIKSAAQKIATISNESFPKDPVLYLLHYHFLKEMNKISSKDPFPRQFHLPYNSIPLSKEMNKASSMNPLLEYVLLSRNTSTPEWQKQFDFVLEHLGVTKEKKQTTFICSEGQENLCLGRVDDGIYYGYVDITQNDDIFQSGWGELRTCKGNLFKGIWGHFKGDGTITYSDGTVYTGLWSNRKRNGQGSYQSKDGSLYEGGWKDDLYHGSGVITLLDVKISGTWKNGHYHGIMTLTPLDQNFIVNAEVEYLDGKKTNTKKDVLRYKNDCVFTGEFSEKLMVDGEGSLETPFQYFFDGTFCNDVFVQGKMSCFINGNKYTFELYQEDIKKGFFSGFLKGDSFIYPFQKEYLENQDIQVCIMKDGKMYVHNFDELFTDATPEELNRLKKYLYLFGQKRLSAINL